MEYERVSLASKSEGKIVPFTGALGSGDEQASAPHRKHEVGRCLVADDDRLTKKVISTILEKEGWEVDQADSAEAARDAVGRQHEVVFLDIYMTKTGATGLEVIPDIREAAPRSQVVIISGTHSVADGANAIKSGAFDFLTKPVQPDELIKVARNALSACRALTSECSAG